MSKAWVVVPFGLGLRVYLTGSLPTVGFGLAVVSGPVDSLGTLINMCKCAGKACILCIIYDARWTAKAKFDDLYPLLFVMVLGMAWGWGGV